MSFEAFPAYPPVDGELVDRIVCKLKSQGIFDQFRKDCLADVDTKPAYQNLQQRVNGTVATFLATQTWQQDLNKTQLRESLRRHVQQGFLEVGVDRIVDQVVNPKVFTVFMPKVEDVVYDCLGIEKPKHPPPSNNLLSGRKLTLLDLLPKDLDPVSPDSDNLSFDDDETKDETNNNENSSKLDISHDSQVSGISDLSSHMGDSFKETQENNIDSNTVKSVTSVKENSTEPHFENFENLSEKIKQAEIGGHNSATSPLPVERDNTESNVTIEYEQKDNRVDTLMDIDSVSNSTFEDTKTFNNKIIKEDTCSRTISEDSLSCSSFNAKFNKDKSKAIALGTSENSSDRIEVETPCKELSFDKEVDISYVNEEKEVKLSSVDEDVDLKTEENILENKDSRKTDELKDKKHRESSSSKTSKSSRPSDSKHRSSTDKKDDTKQNKEKTYKEDKDKEKSNKDEKERSSKHKDDRHHSSKDKYKDKDKNDRSREKDSDKKKDKPDFKDSSEKDKKNDKDKYRDKDKNDKEKTRNDKENHKYDKEKSRSEKDKDRHEKEKDKYDKDRHEKNKKDKEKDKREKDKNETKEKDRDNNEKDKEKTEKDRSRDRDRGKSEKDYKNEKDKESKPIDDKLRDGKKRDSKKYDKASTSSSSSKKDDNNKSETKDKSRRNDENGSKEKTSNTKSGKNDEEKRERKRKSERCNDEIKLKEARRSWDRDSSGGNGKGHGSQKSNNNDCKVSSSSSSVKEKRTGESSNHQKANERKLEPVSDAEEPSDVDKILMKINSSIEESQNIQSNDEQAIKKPKIARNIFEIRKIMQARKNIARQAFKQDKKRKEHMDSVEEVDVIDSSSTTEAPSRDNPQTQEENKENIKAGQMDKLKNLKFGLIKGKFNGFLESDIEQSRNSLQIFRAHFSNFCTSLGMEVLPTENIERFDFTKISDISDDLLDNNLNKLKPKPVSLERRKTYPDDSQVSKAVENIMSGKNGCYVLLQDCNEVVEAMRNASQPPLNKSNNKLTPSKSPQNSGTDGDSNKIISEKNLKVLDHIPKKESSSSNVVRPVSQILDCAMDVVTELVSNTCEQQLKQQSNSVKKIAIRTPPAKQQLATQDDNNEEAFSPVADVTIALNTYLNDSKEILPSVPLTEAMLDNLMQQSSIVVEDETFVDSDDSIHEYENLKRPEVSEESGFEKEESDLRTSVDISDSSDGEIIPSDSNDDEPKSKKIANVINSSTCDIFSHDRDSNEASSEIKVIKRRNQRLCRSVSQRYDSTDLYKPRPVLPQNSKRVRTPRSVSSEDVSTRGLYESTPSKKRAR